MGTNGILECKTLSENMHRTLLRSCLLVAKGGWLSEREGVPYAASILLTITVSLTSSPSNSRKPTSACSLSNISSTIHSIVAYSVVCQRLCVSICVSAFVSTAKAISPHSKGMLLGQTHARLQPQQQHASQ
jgi:hypothetical protein